MITVRELATDGLQLIPAVAVELPDEGEVVALVLRDLENLDRGTADPLPQDVPVRPASCGQSAIGDEGHAAERGDLPHPSSTRWLGVVFVDPVEVPQVGRDRRVAENLDQLARVGTQHRRRIARIDADPPLEEEQAVRPGAFDPIEHFPGNRHPVLVDPVDDVPDPFQGIRRVPLRRPGLFEVPQERDPQRRSAVRDSHRPTATDCGDGFGCFSSTSGGVVARSVPNVGLATTRY